jgi:hypothetical protein
MASPEHQAIAEIVNDVLSQFAKSGLVGVFEGQRRTFDYSCLLARDLDRPVVAQVLWQHEHGLEKDIRTLLFDAESLIKLYIVRDSTRIRATLDDVITSYRQASDTRQKLTGLKLVFVPPDFDAGREQDRSWLRLFLSSSFSQDIAFGIAFGGFSKHAWSVFMNHGGPIGLKYAILHEIAENGLIHTPTFKDRLGYKVDGPIREAIAMLNAAGFIRRYGVCCFPTIRGRFLLDFTRRLLVDINNSSGWSFQTVQLFDGLGTPIPSFPFNEIKPGSVPASDEFGVTLLHAMHCNSHFGRDLLAKVDLHKPVFYSQFLVDHFITEMLLARGFSAEFFSEPEYFFVPKEANR